MEKKHPSGPWQPISPSLPTEPVVSRGRVQFSERRGGRTLINIKKEIQREFKDLRDRNATIYYEIELHRNHPSFKDRVEKITRERRVPPFLLSLFKDASKTKEVS